jgi:zinc transporter 1
MLNDLISLVVALWAIRLADQRHQTHSKYSYGWQRAEILGALFNGKE